MIKIENIKAFTALNRLREYNGKNPYLKKLKNELISKGKVSLTSTQEEYIISNFDFEPYKVDRVIGISEYLGEEFKKKYDLPFVPNKMYIGFILGENEKSFHVFGKLKKNQKQNEIYWVPKTQIMEDPYYTPVDIDIDFEKYEEKDKLGRKLYEHQKDGIKFLVSRKKCILADDMGLGKVIANDTPVLTPDGWVNHGSLVIGDYVIGSNGKPTRVTGVYPNPIKDYYRITFTDGSVVEACDEHLWAVQTPTQKKNNRGYNILTIKDMLDKDKTITIRGKGYNSDKKYTSKTFYKMKNGDCKWYIPMVKPVEFNEKPVSLDPYLLGVLLGDGSLSQRNITLTNADGDLITEVESVLPNNILLSNYKKDISFGFKMADPKAVNTLKFGLNAYNLMGTKSHNKFIPDDYKYNSIDVRLGVLQGLLDTDGWCSKSDGTIQYYSISKQLSDDTKELVQSFGGVARQTKKIGKYKLPNGEVKECNTCYVLTINLPENILPFRLKRKLDNMKGVKKYHPSRGIKKIEFSRKTLGQCISVEAEDNLYVIDNYVVTHNTIQSVMGTLAAESKKVLIICPSSTKINWEREINMFGEYDTSIISGRKWKPAKYTIINYDILKNFHTVKKRGEKPIEELTNILDEKFDTLIVDEAHYLKNHQSIRGSIVTDLVKKNAFENVWLLTGTPVANRPKDLYNLLKIIGHPLSDNWQFYVKRYCDAKNFKKKMKNGKIKNIWVIDGNSNLNELSIRIKNKVLRRMKEDVLDMPEKTIIPVFNELTSKEWVEYDNLWEEYLIKRQEQKKRGSPQRDLVELILLRQFIALKAIPNTIELAENALEDGKKIIIFTTFTDELLELQEYFGNQCVVHNGSMGDKDKQFSVDEFQNNPKKKVFIGNIMSAGVGITLTAADTVIFNSFDWVPGNNEQAEDRCVFANQLVMTSEGYKMIEDIKIGDMVYTHNGNFKRVLNTHTHLERKKTRVDINAFGYNNVLSLTNDHKVYVYDIKDETFKWVEAGHLDIINHRLTLKSNNQPNKRKEYLEVVNYIDGIFKNNHGVEQKNGRLSELPEKVELTNELLYAFGFFIAEGWAIDENDNKSASVNVCQKIDNKKMYDASEHIITIIKRAFNIKSHGEYIDKINCKTCTIYSKNLAINFNKWFGKGVKNKQLPDWVDELNNEQLENLLEGFYHGDGYRRKNTQQSVSVSDKLGSQLIRYNANLGRGVSLKVVNQTYYDIEYTVDINNKLNRIYKVDDYITFPIKSLHISKPKRGEERVYDLSVEDDHSFIVGNYNVHNCYRIGQKNNVSVYYQLFEDTISTRMWYTLKHKKNVIDQIIGNNNDMDDIVKDIIE